MKACLMVIDPQNDFCDPKGALFVTGADKDCERLAKMIDRVGPRLDDIKVTLDSHHKLDIAHPKFWVDSSGANPKPFTLITHKDVANGVWMPFHPGLRDRAMAYTDSLESHNRYVLCIWPEHCLIGTWGHNVMPCVRDALLRWEDSPATITWVTKGSNLYTEHYSAVQADVPDPGDPTTMLNMDLIQDLQEYDIIGFTGEALSHCVANTGRDIVRNFGAEHVRKIHLITDCCSNVPGFEQLGTDFVEDMRKAGMQFCKSTEFLS